MGNKQRFLRTYSGQELVSKYKMNMKGIWHVRGEDPNCDMGGSHSQPHLGYYKGTLDEVINLAVDLPGFWQWGSGGSINLITIDDVDSVEFKRKEKLREEKKKLEQRLAEIVDQINGV